jgi:hypothetical protein
MPVFHFNSFTGDKILRDVEGEELPDLATARRVAERSARETLIEAVKTGDVAPDRIQITDNEGREIDTITVSHLLGGSSTRRTSH